MAHLLYYTQQTNIQRDIEKPKQIRNDIRKFSNLLTRSNWRYAYAWYNINLILYLFNEDNIQPRATIYKCSWHANNYITLSHSACWFFYYLWQIFLLYLFTSVYFFKVFICMTQWTYMTDILHLFYWSFDYTTLILSRHVFQIQHCQTKSILYL